MAFCLNLINLFEPAFFRADFLFVYKLGNYREYRFNICNYRNIRLKNLIYLGCININMNDFCIRAELAYKAGSTVIKTNTGCNYYICIMHCNVSSVASVHTNHSNKAV